MFLRVIGKDICGSDGEGGQLVISFDEVLLLWTVEVADHIAGDRLGYVVVEMGVIDDGVGGSR